MKIKTKRRILSLVLTLLMIVGSTAMLAVSAEQTAEVECKDAVGDGDHVCDTCGGKVSTLIDYTERFINETVNTEVYKGGAKINGMAVSGSVLENSVKDVNYNGRYEITYWVEDPSYRGVAFSVVRGKIITNELSTGRIGWMTVGRDLTKLKFFKSTSTVDTIVTPERDLVDGKQSFKVIVDLVNKTASLYVLSEGEYKIADRRALSTISNLQFDIYNVNNIPQGYYVAVGGVTVTEICSDTDKDHICNECNKEIYELHIDEDVKDHVCDVCGVTGMGGACVDSADDKDHLCDYCNDDSKVMELCTWDCGVVVKEPTCTETGERLYTCTVCGDTKIEVEATCGHEWNELICGFLKTCDVCGEKGGSVLDGINNFKNNVENMIEAATEAATEAAYEAAEIAECVQNTVEEAVENAVDIYENVVETVTGTVEAIKTDVNKFVNGFKSKLDKVFKF